MAESESKALQAREKTEVNRNGFRFPSEAVPSLMFARIFLFPLSRKGSGRHGSCGEEACRSRIQGVSFHSGTAGSNGT